jgi:hypothetical protein
MSSAAAKTRDLALVLFALVVLAVVVATFIHG